MIFKIALRYLILHKRKSIVIGIIFFMCSLIMTIGNGITSGISTNLKENIVDNFIGDMIIVSTNQKDNLIFVNVWGEEIAPINNYPEIKKFLQKQNYIENFLPILRGVSMIFNENGDPYINFIIGVDFEDYRKMFKSNLTIIEGRGFNKNERGMIFSYGNRIHYYNASKIWIIPENTELITNNLPGNVLFNINNLKIKNDLVLMGIGGANVKDVRIPVKGIGTFKGFRYLYDFFDLIDINSFRECFNYDRINNENVNLSEYHNQLLSLDDNNLDTIFDYDSLIGEVSKKEFSKDLKLKKVKKIEKASSLNVEDGIYNIILVKFKKNISSEEGKRMFDEELKKENPGIRALLWKEALVDAYSWTNVIKNVIEICMYILFIVGVIIITNVINMSIIDRTTEIAMMRSIGANKEVIGKMIFMEILILAIIFGILGILTGSIVIKILKEMNIVADYERLAFQVFYGGSQFNPVLGKYEFLKSFMELIIVTLLSTIYPILLSSKISPKDAISRE